MRYGGCDQGKGDESQDLEQEDPEMPSSELEVGWGDLVELKEEHQGDQERLQFLDYPRDILLGIAAGTGEEMHGQAQQDSGDDRHWQHPVLQESDDSSHAPKKRSANIVK